MYLQKILDKIHNFQCLKRFLIKNQENRFASHHIRGEGGFILLTTLAAILLLGAAYTSFAFTLKKQWNWDLNYAMGQQFTQVANAAHLYVQAVAYDPDYATPLHPQRNVFLTGAGPGNQVTVPMLIAAGFLPADFTLNQRQYNSIQIRAFGDRAPRGGGTSAAPTAFVAIDIDIAANRRRTGADIAAFKAGAASKGLARLGMVNPNSPVAAAPCGGNPSFVRWGDNPNDCLSFADVAVITNDATFAANFDGNDVIAPAWEVVTSANDMDALYRYPQPGRPDAQIVNTELRMDGGGANSIQSTRYIDTDVLTVTNQMNVNAADAANPDVGVGSMTVGDPTNPVSNSSIGGNANVIGPDGSVLVDNVQVGNGFVIDGDLDIVLGGLNEGPTNSATLNIPTGELGIITSLEDQGAGLALNLGDNDLIVTGGINQLSGTFSVDANAATGNVGNLQAPTSSIDIGGNDVVIAIDSSTGEIIVDDVVLGGDAEFGSLTMGTGQTATIGGSVDINGDCFGQACPDALTQAPDDPF